MTDAKLRIHFREPAVDLNLPITDGTVRVDGFKLDFIADEKAEYDVWDNGFGARVVEQADSAPVVSVPAFTNRKFRLSYIYVNSAAGIESPRDLEGRRVGIMMWSNTAGVWARGALQHRYGVDLTSIRWCSTHPQRQSLKPTFKIEGLPKRDTLDSLLVAGQLDAVIEPNVLPSISRKDPRVRRLFRDHKSEEQTYFRETGIFPISHMITLRQEFVDRHPDAPVEVLRAFRRARDEAFNRIVGSDPAILVLSWASAYLEEQRALMGENYWPYNLADNERPLKAFTQYAYEQGVTPRQLPYDGFFHADAAKLPGQ
ncbi:MAG TPA: ABC transporter substrate-binding protein [Dehalococcoidia bacterium]|nr:ABC transporter substrate-binding protein [Dehalococcoidia bacterium]